MVDQESDRLHAAQRPTATASAPVQVMHFGCQSLADAEPQALAVTFWFDTAPTGVPFPLTIRIFGRRAGLTHKAGPKDRFDVHTSVDRVVPGSGRIAVTTRIVDIAPGEWRVTARLVRDPNRPGEAGRRRPGRAAIGETGWAPAMQVLAPGVRLGAWPALVTAGAAAALSVQVLLAAHAQLSVTRLLWVSLAACLLGVAGAKLYYLVWHPAQWRKPLRAGMCIQGFVLAAIVGLLGGALVADLGVGMTLDVSTPGLMFGMTVGRFGCFFGGCCAGRPTASQWGLWSSDRRIGARRIPTQLLEALLATIIGVGALITVWTGNSQPAGVAFVAVIAAYTLGRQLLFPLRDLPRQTAHGRAATLTVAGLVLVASIAVAVVG